MHQRRWVWLARLCLGAVGVAVALQLAITALLYTVYFFASVDNNIPESMIVWQAQALARGESPYRDFTHPPFIIGFYGPLLYGIPALCAKLFALGAPGIRYAGRAMSLLATAGACWIIYDWARRTGVRRAPALAALALLLTQRWILAMAVGYRADHPAFFFALLGSYLLACRRRAAWAVPCFLIAYLFKQSFLTAPLAMAAWELTRRNARGGARWFLPWAALQAATILALNLATGWIYYQNTTRAYVNTVFMLRHNLEMIAQWIYPEAALVTLALAAAVVRQARHAWRDPVLIYFCVSLAINLLLIGNPGSSFNYLLEPLGLGTILIARLFDAAWEAVLRRPRGAHAAALAVALALAVWIAIASGFELRRGLPDLRQAEADLKSLEITTRAWPDEWVLSDNSALALRTGGRPLVLEDFRWRLFCEHHVIPLEPYLDLIHQRRVKFIIGEWDPNRLQFPMQPIAGLDAAIAENYQIRRTVGTWAIAEPKQD